MPFLLSPFQIEFLYCKGNINYNDYESENIGMEKTIVRLRVPTMVFFHTHYVESMHYRIRRDLSFPKMITLMSNSLYFIMIYYTDE